MSGDDVTDLEIILERVGWPCQPVRGAGDNPCLQVFDDEWAGCDQCRSLWPLDSATGIDRECLHCDDGGPLPPASRGNRERRAEPARTTGMCSRCPPHSGDNAGRKPKHGAKKKRGRKP